VFRVGVIGTGFGRRVVAPAFDGLPDGEVVDVVSARDEQAVARLCARGDLALVCVHSPPFLHLRHVAMALAENAPRAVLCDKPLATSAEESAAMLKLARDAAVLHFTNFEFRFLEARQEMRSVVTSGEIGDPAQIVWTHLSAGTSRPLRSYGWLFDRAMGGGWIGAWASHAVDTVRWLLGDVHQVFSVSGTLIDERPDSEGLNRRVGAEDSLSCVLIADHDRLATLTSSFAAPTSIPPRILVIGTEGIVECIDDRTLVVTRGDGSVREWRAPDGERHMRAMNAWARVIRDSAESGLQCEPSFADGLACDRILDQLRSGPWVRWAASAATERSGTGLDTSINPTSLRGDNA